MVETMVITQGLAAECIPHMIGMLIVFVTDAFTDELAIESLLWWQPPFIKVMITINVVVRMHTFSSQQFQVIFTTVGSCKMQIFLLQILRENI